MAMPPGPALPPALQTLRWAARPGPFMQRAQRDHGDVFTVRLAQVGTFVFVADPGEIKRIFTGDPQLLRAGEANTPLEPVLGSRSVLLLDGAEHLRQRRLMLPSFHGARLSRYEELMTQITERAVAGWPVGSPFPLQPRTQEITLEVILRVVFGMAEGERLRAMRDALVRLLSVSTSRLAMLPWLRRDFGPGSWWRRFLSLRADVDRLLYAEIAERRRAAGLEDRDDILSLLLQARDDDGCGLTDGELRDELMTLLIAGHETTATALAWAFERLFRTPEALERLETEADAGDESTYADAVVTETLRLRAPLPVVARMLHASWEIAGYRVPPGVRLAPCIYLVHRRPDVYPDPEAFRPERFLERAPETYTWLPFGGGIRRCLGASFAQFEMRVVLQTVVRQARLRAPQPDPEPMRRRAIIFAPARGGEAILAMRERRPAPRRAAATV